VNRRTRAEDPIPRTGYPGEDEIESEFIRQSNGNDGAVGVFEDPADGLESLSWSEFPSHITNVNVGVGSYGQIRLAYKRTEIKVPIESRHLAAIKVQPKQCDTLEPEFMRTIWNEIRILRGVVHENVIDYYGHFMTISRRTGIRRIWIILEYASAGDLSREMDRYGASRISESGARYYMMQIIAGVKYLHDKFIVHNDLYSKNILLKYNPDGSKTCMICDFGLSTILDPDSLNDLIEDPFKSDVTALMALIPLMLGTYDESVLHSLSPDARTICMKRSETPATVDLMLQKYRWFGKKAIAPFPKVPTPLLPAEKVDALGYLPQQQPAPGWSNVDIAKRRISSIPGQVSKSVRRMRSQSGEASPSQAAATPVAESGRRGFGQRIRRSISAIGQRFNCFSRRRQASDATSRVRSPSPQAGPSGIPMQEIRAKSSPPDPAALFATMGSRRRKSPSSDS
jgi:hypothetical protein